MLRQFARGVSWSFFSHHWFWLLDLFFYAASPSLEQTSPSKERSEYFTTSIRLSRLYSGAQSLCWPSAHCVMKLYSERTQSWWWWWWWWCDKTRLAYIPEFLKTGLAKIRAHSTTWQLKAIKSVQRPIKKPISDAEQYVNGP